MDKKKIGRPLLTPEQVERLKPYESKLSKFTLSPRRIGYLAAGDKAVIAEVYKEVTHTVAPCTSCENTWICKMNIWYQESKAHYESQPGALRKPAGRKPSTKKSKEN